MHAQDPYTDSDGKPKLRPSVTGFIDVLGFSQLSKTLSAPEESQAILNRVASAIQKSRAMVRESFAHHSMAGPNCWALKFFSDNLVFGFPTDGASVTKYDATQIAVHCVQHYQLHMALHGFFVRGALSLGPICISDEIIFGPALIESYELESKASIVPRVILAEPLPKLSAAVAEEGLHGADSSICRDIDGQWFVNYLHAAVGKTGVDWQLIERHKVSILGSLSKLNQHHILPKFGWSCRYHNVFCHWHRNDPGFSDHYRIERVDEHSSIELLRETTERLS
ncbi:hypothetical protein [Roseiconus lacunae]|uniref:Guanylate cyclase domain-containing protein n=1 Tax=Roseiconus lacunae TaxID=2605694 RepID=A0ABT7PP30_9BACT|nr:hypothetical protein [Roseiconus lacunae]MDM4018242.1 hypothetical protein [Roseiconus lacunae]